jgi:plastocyanin
MLLRRALPAIVLAAVILTGCGGDDDTDVAAGGGSATTAALSDETVFILAVDNSFNPEEQTVPAGATVVWENRGRNDHDIVPEDPDAPWAVGEEAFAPGDTAEFRFTEPGTYRYYCSIHGTIDVGMPGVLIVE